MDDCIIGSLLLLLLLLLVDDSRVVKDRLVTMFLVDLRALASKVDILFWIWINSGVDTSGDGQY